MNTKKEHIFSVKGMHCPSCEILIEKKILGINGVKSVDASTAKNQVIIECENECPNIHHLNRLFSQDGYTFYGKTENDSYVIDFDNVIKIVGISIFIIFAFFTLNYLGFGKYANVSAKSSLPTFFILGLIAGVSSCAALVGGLVLSMSKQWLELYQTETSSKKKMKPHILFNIGRIASYGFFGAILGAVGTKLQVSPTFSIVLIFGVSVLMICLALQMLSVRAFRRFQFTMPKFITRRVADEKNFQGRYMPAVMGAATFFLPCGFTITAQGIALISGSAIQGFLIMILFALGTAPAILAIGLTSVKLGSRPHLAGQFSKIAGIIILFFALYNINAQLNVLGWKNFDNFLAAFKTNTDNTDDPIDNINGTQVIKMNASARGYKPNYFKVKAGMPVRLEVTDVGTSGCTNAIVSRLWDGAIELTPGKTSIKEFTPKTPKKYKFSCWMGMVSGTIEVVK